MARNFSPEFVLILCSDSKAAAPWPKTLMRRQWSNPKQRQAHVNLYQQQSLSMLSNIYAHITNQCGGPCEFSKMQMFAYKNSLTLVFTHLLSGIRPPSPPKKKPGKIVIISFHSFDLSENNANEIEWHHAWVIHNFPKPLKYGNCYPHSSELILRLFEQTFGTHPERNLYQQAK